MTTTKRKVSVNFKGVEAPQPQVDRAWSAQQNAVFDWGKAGKGNLLVRARAGTGKTTTIVEMSSRMPERQILLAAFNKGIAVELQARVSNPRVEVKTLHGLGLKYVRRNWQVRVEEGDERGDRAERLARRACEAYAEAFSTQAASDPVVRHVAKLHTKARELIPCTEDWQDLLDVAARFDLMPDDEWEAEGWTAQAVCMCAFRAMRYACERTDVVDYADMIFLPLRMRWVRPWFDAVIVDEAQDMTDAQLDLALGACRRTGRVAIVGDDRQAIYAFRGADCGSIDRLKEALRATELGLTVTYRCASRIVDLARELVADFQCAPGAAPGEIKRCDADAMLDGVREGDFVVSRTNAPLVRICMALLKRGVRARVRGREVGRGVATLIKKFRAASVKDIEPKLVAYVARETEKASKLKDEAREARVQFVEDQAAIVRALCENATTVAEVLSRCDELFSDDKMKAVAYCSTVHRVKGLEAERTWLLEGTFRRGKIEEENLRYVAITRAKSTLTWVSGYEKPAKGAEA